MLCLSQKRCGVRTFLSSLLHDGVLLSVSASAGCAGQQDWATLRVVTSADARGHLWFTMDFGKDPIQICRGGCAASH
jgi:hypothetical protein